METAYDMRPENQEFRRNIRKLHQAQRDRMIAAEVREKSDRIVKWLLQSEWYEGCQVIYGYYPLGKEVDCRSFLERAIADGKTVALPATGSGLAERSALTEKKGLQREARPKKDNRMEFFEVHSLDEVAEGNFHVMEPLLECALLQEERAVVLVPGVVFDRNGNRYGYGGGYYDRYFSRFHGLYRVALCYEHQFENELLTLPTDIHMHEIVTEMGTYHCAKVQKWDVTEKAGDIWS